jgi:hypothetical protein
LVVSRLEWLLQPNTNQTLNGQIYFTALGFIHFVAIKWIGGDKVI